ncbi:hypothetical protein D3C72_1421610 [compost metagenome]
MAAPGGDVGQGHFPGRRNGFAHLQRGARRRIHLVAVVGLEDLDVIAGVQDARGHVQQLERGIDAHAHVRREYDGGFLSSHFDRGAAIVVEAGGADDGLHTMLHAGLQVRKRALGAGEIDQAVGAGQRVQVIRDGHAGLLAQRGAGIAAQRAGALAAQRHGQLQAVGLQDGLDQHLAHAAVGAGNSNTHKRSLFQRSGSGALPGWPGY